MPSEKLLKLFQNCAKSKHRQWSIKFIKAKEDELRILTKDFTLHQEEHVVKRIRAIINNQLTKALFVNLPTNIEEEEIIDENMALTSIEFQKYALSLLPEYDGSPSELIRFIDALTLLNLNKSTHEEVAIAIIKTKLKGMARALITTESTIEQIKDTLNNSIKPDSSNTVIMKMKAVKQSDKFIYLHGFPNTILTDGGTDYNNQVLHQEQSSDATWLSGFFIPR